MSTIAAASITSATPDVSGFITVLTTCAVAAAVASVLAQVLVLAGKPASAAVGHGHAHPQ